MHSVFQLAFDPATTARIGQLQRSLQAAALIQESPPAIGPHVTVLSSDLIRDRRCEEAANLVFARLEPLSLELSFVGLFRGPPPFLFLGITTTSRLLGLQRQLFDIVNSAGIAVAPFSQIGRTVFHCTLGILADPNRLSEAYACCETLDWPLSATCEKLELVEYYPSQVIRCFHTAKSNL